MFEFFTNRITSEVSRAVKAGIAPLAGYLKMLVSGMALVMLSVFAFSTTLLFLSVALFLHFSVTLNAYTEAALWVTLLNGLFGTILLLFGLSLLRRPR